MDAPGAPSGLSATADGETEIDLSWGSPSSDGGSRITGYRIEVSEDGSNWRDLEADTRSTSTRYTHSRLTGGSTRYYRVSAINSRGVSPTSNSANATTDSVDAPGAPSGLSATADGETEIDLSWGSPSSDGGSRITGYRIEVSEDGSNWRDLEADTRSTSTRYTHSRLTGGSTRYYRVSAINSRGVSPASNSANATTDSVDAPGAPSGLSATADGETEIDLSWGSPSSDGGSRITGYRIEVSEDGSNWRDLEADTRSTSTRYTHSRLTGGSTRYYRVSAINSRGVSPASNSANATTDSVDAPGAPSGLSATADGETEIDLSWGSPSSDGGSRITGYRIEVSEDGSNWRDLEADTRSTSTRYTHSRLTGGSTRYYRVSAINSRGVSPASNSANATTDSVDAPGAPSGLSATADGETEIDLSWGSPSSDGGSRITGYRIEVSEDGSNWRDLEADTRSTSTRYTHSRLTGGSTRYYRVSAINSRGVSPASNSANATTDSVDAPGAPSGLSATADGETEIDLSWGSPSSDGGSRITGYRIEVSEDGSNWRDLEADTRSTSTRYTHSRLTGGSTRYYRVSAINAAGGGQPSNTANATTVGPCSHGSDPTPLHRAVEEGDKADVRRLAGLCPGDLNVISSSYAYDQTPLSLAIGDGDKEIVRILVDAGADPDKKVNMAFREGTHLTYAIGQGDSEIVQILLDADADPNVVDTEQFYDQTPLSLAIGASDADMMRKLIAAGADPDKKVNVAFGVGTHLTYAVGLGDTGVVQILLNAGADPNVVDTEQFYDESPLSIAVKAQGTAMVRILVAAGADPNQKLAQFDEVSPLDIAIKEGYTEIVEILTGTSN